MCITTKWMLIQKRYNDSETLFAFPWLQHWLQSDILREITQPHDYSLVSSTLPLASQRGLFSNMVYWKGGTSQLAKSSFFGTLQLFNCSFFSLVRFLRLPGGLPGLTLYPAALVVPRGLPGLVLKPAALVVPMGRPVLVRYPANFVVPAGLPLLPDFPVPFFFLVPSGFGASLQFILTCWGWKSFWESCNWHAMDLCTPCGRGVRPPRGSCRRGLAQEG